MKKIAASDSRQSVGLKWKTRKGLEDNVAFKEDGTMEVGKNLDVDGNATFAGKNCFVWHGAVTDTIEGMSIASTVSGLFFHGTVLSVDGQTMGDPGIFALIAVNDDGLNFYFEKPLHYDPSTQEERPATVEEILSGNWSPYLSLDGAIKVLTDRSDGRLTTLRVNKLVGSENEPTIDWIFKVENENISLGEIAQAAKKVKYQHTVTIKGTRPAQGGGACFLTFTARSPKNTPIDSAQDLIDVFGGCDLSVSGMYSPAQGTNFGAVKLYLKGASTIADVSLAYIDPSIINESGVKISECGNLSFSDDVFPN